MRRSSRTPTRDLFVRAAARTGQTLLIAALAVAGLSTTATAAPAPAASSLTGAEQDAFAKAKATGEPVVVADAVTETSQVLVKPDGRFVYESSAAPQRVKRGDKWQPVDAALRAAADGTLTPAAAPLDVSFSGGGTAPYVTLKSAQGQVALHWPTPLPAPRVDGSTATYAGVLPGVDLVLAASPLSYQQVLVVHDADAAANPALRQVKVTARSTGLTVRTGADGALSAVDAEGEVVFTGSTPTMWDSARPTATDPAPTATDPKAARVDKVTVTAREVAVEQPAAAGKKTTAVRNAEISVLPDVAALTRPGVKYPVYVDPSLTGNQLAWGETTANGFSYFNAAMVAQVGRCNNSNGDCGSLTTARSYFRLNTEPIKPRSGWAAVVWTAGVYTTQVHGANGCTAEPVRLWSSGPIFSGMSWNNPGLSGHLDTVYSAAGDQCGGAGGVPFTAPPVKDFVQTAANGGWNDITIALAADNESLQSQWKKFATSGAAAPKLVAEFSYRPNQPTGLLIPAAGQCWPYSATVATATPTLHATATDNNSPTLPVILRYEIYNRITNALVTHSNNSVVIASGTTGTWTTPTLPDGDYRYQVGALSQYPGDANRNLWGPAYSSVLDFNVRTAPLLTPVVKPSPDYPSGAWGSPANSPGSISVSDPGSPGGEVEGFTYTFNGPGTEVLPGPTDCDFDKVFGLTGGWVSGSSATIRLPAGLSPGYHTLHVRSFDRSHKLSPETQAYQFYVAPTTLLSPTKLEAESMTVSQPGGQGVTIATQANCCGVTWSNNAQVHFYGTAANQSFTLGFTVGAEQDYDLGLGVTRSTDYGQVAYAIDGQAVGQPSLNGPVGSFELFEWVVRTRHVPLGTRRLTAGAHTLTVTVTGTNGYSMGQRYHAGVDYLLLTPTGRFEAEQPSQVTPTQPPGQSMTVARQNQAGGGTYWSEGAQLGFDATAAGASVELAFKVPVEADYALGVNLARGPQQGQVTIKVDDVALAKTDDTPWDGYQAAAGTTYLPLGGAHLGAGTHKVKITVTGKHASSSGYKVGVDYFGAVAFAAATAVDFTSAMNNNGIAPEGTAADLDTNGLASISAQTMAAAGLAPGSSFTVDGATFVMPAHRADGNDNVIAHGQTIPLPLAQQIKSSAVGLLVVDTCYAVPQRSGAVTYVDNTVDRPQFPTVPDWFLGPKESAHVVLPHFNLGTAIATTGQPRLYTIFVPTDPTKTLKSVTLPNYGTPFVPGCAGGPALHVLAIAPRPVQAGWLGAWSAQPDTTSVPPGGVGFANQTVRTVVHPSLTGSQVRVTLSNSLNPAPVTVSKVSVGAQQGTGVDSVATPAAVLFGGSASVTIPAGGEVTSDAVAFPAGGTGNLVVSAYHATALSRVPVHSRPTAPVRIGSGDLTATASGTGFATVANGSYLVSGLQVSTSDNSLGTVVVLGDQQSAAAGTDASAGHTKTWVDRLPGALTAAGTPLPGSIVNASRSGLTAAATWQMNEPSGTTLTDSSGSFPATLAGTSARTAERGGAVDFDGSTGHAVVSGNPIKTTESYTISAWVKLESTTWSGVVFSCGTGGAGSLELVYSKPNNAWALGNHGGGASALVLGPAPVLNTWTHLVGTYDVGTKEMRLYVNGALVAFAPRVSADVAGPFVIGAAKSAGGVVSGYFNGSISEVTLFQGAATATDVGVLYRGNAVTGPRAGVGSQSLADAAKTLNRHAYGEPNLRTVVVALGANDVLAGVNKTDILTGFRNVMHQGNAEALRNTRRTDGSLNHVIVATIPALGLAANDPREIVRQQVNADLLNNFTDQGADEVIDIAGTVADPANTNLISPTYLTAGQPNDTYYTVVAAAIAAAASTFPPTAQF
ncbi:LamG-like jellyroll fold domain-containing protein [Actinokineospora diospyrosa]|uniref:Concanavalin A-like lectin/glucanases superfamily protein n=1 Tax=Actinokineospora diospyrosa TaxID=103728 RepID=A0ABT1I6A5_9PSEU|nr:LamG-like jellyroll fold domain-containing protein [Actinokineospora diospyrosa]MCP2268151.1 Concanavalin A-like lectin/glucanases superfamily protein [Actinokineospora diospyrosa]